MKNSLLDLSLGVFILGWLLLLASALMVRWIPEKHTERETVATIGILAAGAGAILAMAVYFVCH
jgi:hypothetical protein